MTAYAIRTEHDRQQALKNVSARDLPFTLNVNKGAPRSIEQNKLQRLWLLEAEEQGDMTAEEYRGFCKLHFGVPILRAENEDFKKIYDEVIRPLDYEKKLAVMRVPIDLPVTSQMTTKQKAKYLDCIYTHFLGLGFVLTEPKRG